MEIISEMSTSLFYAQVLILICALGLGTIFSALSILLQKGTYAVIGLLFLAISVAAVITMDLSKPASLSESLNYFGQFAAFGGITAIFGAFFTCGILANIGGDKK